MKLISIPNDMTKFNIDDVEIDMNNLKFDAPKEKIKYYAFIFLRNIGSKFKLNFDNCSFEDKEEYLKLFLSSNIDVYIPLLSSTWIEILTSEIDNKMYLKSILTRDEIDLFIERNKEFINKIRRLINSLPFYAINRYGNKSEVPGIDEVDIIDDDEIKLINLYQLTEFDSFMLLFNTEDEVIPERKPGFYTLFSDKDNEYNMSRIMNNLPFFNIIMTLLGSAELQKSVANNFIDTITSKINKEV